MFAVAFILTLVWMTLAVVAVVALIRGRLQWARIHTRKAAGWVLAAAAAVMVVSGLVAPKQLAPVQTQAISMPAPTTTVAMAPPTAAALTTTSTVPSAVPAPLPPQAIASPSAPAPAPWIVTVQAPVPQPTAADPVPTSPQWVTPGAFCAPQGATGTSKTGKVMVCSTTATNNRNRWRHE
ncbi:hypothetical protein K7711_27860 [Nocardia sp. CA2R105]|uniref:hypothetical protein n=1 Tax=Nocardia coffeae TaxID=2873381 RepID=UPI001CA70FD3|nr:hypothetical protein [Nocardia coffeae]MBY8860318.1 hypothetical protein [Nocardia coffeae]